MFDSIPPKFVETVKRHIGVTWSDPDTDAKVDDIITDAAETLNDKLGEDVDYTSPGQARRLFLAYCAYAWNDCLDDFDKAYLGEIIQLRNKFRVLRFADEN